MTNQAIARDLLAVLCGSRGMATLVIDLNRTHATNPDWTCHARFHLVWQAAAFAFLSALEVVLILARGPFQDPCFYLAAILASIPMLGFYTAFAARGLYKGKLSDPNGMRPMTIVFRCASLRVDINLVAESVGVLVLAMIVTIYRHSGVQ